MTIKLPGESFYQKALLVILGVLLTGFLGFNVWLATSIIDIRQVAARMDGNIERVDQNVKALVQARATESSQRSQSNSDRLDQIDRNNAQ